MKKRGKGFVVVLIILLLLIGAGYYLVKEGYIDISQFTSAKTDGEATYAIVDYKNNVNLRKEGNKHAEIITSMPPGTRVKVFKVKGEWAYIDYNGTEGWCYNPYLDYQN